MWKAKTQDRSLVAHRTGIRKGAVGAAIQSPQAAKIAQLEEMVDSSPRGVSLTQLAAMVDSSPVLAAQSAVADTIRSNPTTLQRMSKDEFSDLLTTTKVNGVEYTWDGLVERTKEESLLAAVEEAKNRSDVERIIRNVVRDYRTAKGAKGESGHYLKGNLPEDDYSHTEERGDQAVADAVRRLPGMTGGPDYRYLTPGLNPARMGFLIGKELEERGEKALKKEGRHFAEVSFTQESFFEGGEATKEKFFVALRTGAETLIKERIEKIREQKEILNGGDFYHLLLGVVSGYGDEEIIAFLEKDNSDAIKDVTVTVYKYMRKNGEYTKAKLYDIT